MKGKTPTIIAVTALVVAALAASPVGQAAGRLVLAKNSVGTAQLKKNAVTGPKVKNGSLMAADFKAGQLPAGPQGPKGDTGAPGISGLEQVRTTVQIGAGSNGVAMALCPVGKQAIGGGFDILGGYIKITENRSGSVGSLSAWRVTAENSGGGVGGIAAYANCVVVS